MAPVKFGLFKSRSRDQEQPSTENLLQNSTSSDHFGTPTSPMAVAKTQEDVLPVQISDLNIDGEEEEGTNTPVRRFSDCSRIEEAQMEYSKLQQQSSGNTSLSTLQDDYDEIQTLAMDDDGDDTASTSRDADSLWFDETSIAPSEDLSIYCGALKKQKKTKSKEEQQLRDLDMWRASNVEVMQNLLSRSGTLDEQIKWEAIATARGLCTLRATCACLDCARGKQPPGVSDGDAGLGAAPLFNAVTVGCSIQ